MDILVVAAHCDDEVLGVGGTIAYYTKRRGMHVGVVICAHRRNDNGLLTPAENEKYHDMARAAQAELGYQELRFLDIPDEEFPVYKWQLMIEIEKLAREFKPVLVYTQSVHDYNQDHVALAEVCTVAFRPWTGPKALLHFNSSTASPAFNPTMINGLSNSEFKAKMKAWSCYETEKREFPHPRADKAILARMIQEGAMANFPLAESFELSYWRYNG